MLKQKIMVIKDSSLGSNKTPSHLILHPKVTEEVADSEPRVRLRHEVWGAERVPRARVEHNYSAGQAGQEAFYTGYYPGRYSS